MTGYSIALMDYPQAFWTQAFLWPKGDRRHIFLADAVMDVGAAMYGPEVWTGDEPNEAMDYDAGEVALALCGGGGVASVFRDQRVARGQARTRKWVSSELSETIADIGPDFSWHVVEYRAEQHRQQHMKQAREAQEQFERVRGVSEWIGDMGRNGDFATYGRDADDTELFDLPPSVWNVEPVWEKRVRTCSLKHKGRDTLIFLDREKLARCLSRLPFGGNEAGLLLINSTPEPPSPAAPPSPAPSSKPQAGGRKRGRKTNPVWARAYAKAYRQHRAIAVRSSDEQFRKWIVGMNPALGEQASPSHHKTIKSYREQAESGRFDHYLSN